MNHGLEVIPIAMFKNVEVGDKAGKKRALAINKNLFLGHNCNRINRFCHQVVVFCFAAWRSRLERKKNFMEKKEEGYPTKIFAVKTTTGQERNVARLLTAKIEMNHIPIKAILVPETLRGYVFVEADGPHLVEEAITGIRHVRSRVPGIVNFPEIERYIVRKPIIEELSENDVVEVTGGPFKGMRAKITRIDKAKAEVTLELLEATFTLPITVHSDYVKLVQKAKTESGET
jgi:transcriptional antiterminator NusG